MSKFDVAIVLGFDVTENGLLPAEGKSRVETAVGLIKSKKASKLIFSGKVSHLHNYRPAQTEAEAMKAYAVALGISVENILTESRSRNTYQNAVLCKKIVTANNWRSVLVVTSEFHSHRAESIFQRVFGQTYQIKLKTCPNKLKPEELSLIQEMEEIKTKGLRLRKRPKNTALRSKRMSQLLKEYLYQRTAS